MLKSKGRRFLYDFKYILEINGGPPWKKRNQLQI